MSEIPHSSGKFMKTFSSTKLPQLHPPLSPHFPAKCDLIHNSRPSKRTSQNSLNLTAVEQSLLLGTYVYSVKGCQCITELKYHRDNNEVYMPSEVFQGKNQRSSKYTKIP